MSQKLRDHNLDDPILAHLRHDFTVLDKDQTVGEALASLRSQELGEKIVYLYVADEQGALVGVLPTRRLLMSDPETPIRSIMLNRVVAIPSEATVLDACEFFIQHRFLGFPVVDEQRRLIGVVDVGLFTDEVFDVAEQQLLDDVFQLIGVQVARGRKVSPWSGFQGRFPWLLCNIGGGILCAFVAGFFEGRLDAQLMILLALFVPVVLALAESVSIQSMTIILQGLHAERISWTFVGRALGREFLVAIMLGVASGGLVASVAWGWKGEGFIALVLAASICLSMITACLLGVALPMAVRAARADPKIAAGPIVLATADLATLLFYFNLAGLITS